MKVKKDLTLAERTVNFVSQYKNEHSLNSFSAAMDEIVNEYEKYQKGFVDEIGEVMLEKIKSEYDGYIKKLRFSANSADFNTQVLIELFNTLIINMQIQEYYSTTDTANEILTACYQTVKDRIAYYKQIKENNKHKSKRAVNGSLLKEDS